MTIWLWGIHSNHNKHLSSESGQSHAGFTRVNWFKWFSAFNTNNCRRWIKRCYNLDNALNYLSTQSNSAMRAAGVGLTRHFWYLTVVENWSAVFHGKSFTRTNWQAIISKPCLQRLADDSKELQCFYWIFGPKILARRTLTPNCAKKYGLKFTPSNLP